MHGRGIIIPSYGTVLLAPKLGSEGAAGTGKQGFKVGREDEGIIQSSFLKLQYCKPDPTFYSHLFDHTMYRQGNGCGRRMHEIVEKDEKIW